MSYDDYKMRFALRYIIDCNKRYYLSEEKQLIN